MDLTFTQFVSYRNINVDKIDLYEDAFGLNIEFVDVKEFLGQLSVKPRECLTELLMEKIRNQN